MGGETRRDFGEQGNYKEDRPDCCGSAETRRIHETSLGRKTDGRSGKEKSGMIAGSTRRAIPVV
jgi:hypothetical protein